MLKKIQPYLITFSFVVLAVFSLFVSEIFQAPTKSAKDIIKNIQLFRKEELSKLQTLVLTNKNGIFQFDKNQTSELSPWIMTNPKQVTANPLFFEKLLSSLAGSKIKKTYPITEAHLENFSLKTSPTKLEYVNDINQRTKVTFGLHNSIDNSIFILLENSPEIYQIDYLDVNLENIGVNDLIQTTLSALDKNTISAIQIYNGIKKNETLIVNIMKNPPEITGWRLSEKEQGSEEKIFSYLDRISSLKPTQILESLNDQQRKKISNLFVNPKWILTFEDQNKNIITYTVSSVFTDFPELEIKGETFFMIKISNQENFYLFKKEYLNIFDVSKTDFLK